jgi:asparagine synthetase B (glutamine-hydrolysing)
MCGIHAWISCSDTSSNNIPNDLCCSGAEEDWLRRRGPDGVGTVTLEAANGAAGGPERQHEDQPQQLTHHQVHLRASVLQMRTEWQPQPVALLLSTAAVVGVGQDDDKNDAPVPAAAYCAWNGEIYEAKGDDDDDPAAASSSFLDNDTLYMVKRLTRTLDWSACSSSSSRDEQRDTIVATLSSLTNAEYALCIITTQSIFYARDPWGRRSLLTVGTSSSNRGGIMFQVASVATMVAGLEQPDDDRPWTEVPPGILYEYQIETNETHATPFTTTTTALLLVDQSPITALPPPPPLLTMTASAALLEGLLDGAVQRRLRGHASCSILFSGGLDSTLIAALATRYCPHITLLTVSFVDDDDNDITGCDDNTLADPAASTPMAADAPQAADAITAQASYRELVQLYPHASITWNHKVVPYQAVVAVRDRI